MKNQGESSMKRNTEQSVSLVNEEIRDSISNGTFETVKRYELDEESQIFGSRFVDTMKN